MRRVMVLSGAGLSAQSGISTFRDHDGLWEHYDVMQVCSTQGWQADRDLVTRFYNARRADLHDKQPNAMHLELSRLERRYAHRIVHLTQNVDDLMEKAGAKRVVHLHGTLRDLRCERCEEVWDVTYAPQNENDLCPYCGAAQVRHNVVMFGEAAPMYRHIAEAMATCDLFVAIGTSGQVIDIVSIAAQFDRSILINPNRERYFGYFIDEHFTHFIRKGAVEAAQELGALIEAHLDA